MANANTHKTVNYAEKNKKIAMYKEMFDNAS